MRFSPAITKQRTSSNQSPTQHCAHNSHACGQTGWLDSRYVHVTERHWCAVSGEGNALGVLNRFVLVFVLQSDCAFLRSEEPHHNFAYHWRALQGDLQNIVVWLQNVQRLTKVGNLFHVHFILLDKSSTGSPTLPVNNNRVPRPVLCFLAIADTPRPASDGKLHFERAAAKRKGDVAAITLELREDKPETCAILLGLHCKHRFSNHVRNVIGQNKLFLREGAIEQVLLILRKGVPDPLGHDHSLDVCQGHVVGEVTFEQTMGILSEPALLPILTKSFHQLCTQGSECVAISRVNLALLQGSDTVVVLNQPRIELLHSSFAEPKGRNGSHVEVRVMSYRSAKNQTNFAVVVSRVGSKDAEDMRVRAYFVIHGMPDA
eukprot:RCo002684